MSQSQATRRFMFLALLFEMALGVVAIVLGWARGLPPRELTTFNLEGLLAGLVFTVPMVVFLLITRRLAWEPLEKLNRLVSRLVVELFGDASLGQLFLLSLAAGWGEELLFRGYLQPLAADYLGPTAALVLVSLLFGLAHSLSKTYAVLATLIGLYLGWLWLHFDNLLVPIIVHALYDFVALVYLLRISPRRSQPDA